MKKGFTLVELLAVIIILGLVGLIVVPSITRMLEDSKMDLYNEQVAVIEDSTRKWSVENIDRLSETKKTYLSVRDLIADGYIEQNSLKDPRKTKNEMNGCVVIQYNQSYKKYEYDYVDETCRSINTNYNLTSSDPEYVCYEFDPLDGVILYYDKTNLTCSMDVVIPNKIDGVDVRYIDRGAFSDFESSNPLGRYIESVDFPSSIVAIGSGAFAENNISNLNLSDLNNLRYIDEGAFWGNKIETISFNNLPKLEYVENGAFAENYISFLELINLPRLEYIGFDSFIDNQITSLTLKQLNNLEVIYGHAFSNNQISNLILSDLPSLERIGHAAFAYNDIKSLDLSIFPRLVRVGWDSFRDNNIASLNLTGLQYFESIGYGAFYGNNLSNVTIPTSVIEIEADAFYEDSSWVNVTIEYNGTNPITRFNCEWEEIGWPSNLMPDGQYDCMDK